MLPALALAGSALVVVSHSTSIFDLFPYAVGLAVGLLFRAAVRPREPDWLGGSREAASSEQATPNIDISVAPPPETISIDSMAAGANISYQADELPPESFPIRRVEQKSVNQELESVYESQYTPRVLNANFTTAGFDDVLDERTPLRANTAYDLLVDIGPPWSERVSIVTGARGFPDHLLPPGLDGHIIEVLFVSEDFSSVGSGADRHIARGKLWLPQGSGRSHPIVGGEEEDEGPLRLRLHTPPLDETAWRVLHGKLCLYFENNLVQSAAVAVTMVGPLDVERIFELKLKSPNVIKVDYVLAPSFRGLQQLQNAKRPSGRAPGRGGLPLERQLTSPSLLI